MRHGPKRRIECEHRQGLGPYIRSPAPYRPPLPFLSIRQPNQGAGVMAANALRSDQPHQTQNIQLLDDRIKELILNFVHRPTFDLSALSQVIKNAFHEAFYLYHDIARLRLLNRDRRDRTVHRLEERCIRLCDAMSAHSTMIYRAVVKPKAIIANENIGVILSHWSKITVPNESVTAYAE